MDSSKNIFLIDDDIDDCDFFSLALKTINPSHRFLTANNGEEALIKLRSRNPLEIDVIFLDLNMPRMDGKTCLTELKQDNTLAHIPVVIFSTSSDPRDIRDTKNMGAKDFITKPCQLNILCKEIRKVIDGL